MVRLIGKRRLAKHSLNGERVGRKEDRLTDDEGKMRAQVATVHGGVQ